MKVTTDACLFGAWVARQVREFTSSRVRLLDVGTGTGLLSLMVAQSCAGKIEALEIDPSAAEQARENVAASPWAERISIVRKDVLQWRTATSYDIIFSNPPFYENELRSAKSPKNVAHHDEGLRLADLFTFIKNHLREDGAFFLLLPAKREKELEPLLANHQLFLRQKVFVQQTLKHPPFRMMIQGCRKQTDAVSEEKIVIKNERNEYTPKFVSLLKAYYLYL